jgi:hypothetical protein
VTLREFGCIIYLRQFILEIDYEGKYNYKRVLLENGRSSVRTSRIERSGLWLSGARSTWPLTAETSLFAKGKVRGKYIIMTP